jgi:hypothetical protein
MKTLAVIAALALGGAADASAADWKFNLTPYAWTTDVGVDARLGDRELVDHTIAFTDLLKDLDTVAQVRFEGAKGSHGFMVDLFDVRLSQDGQSLTVPTTGQAARVDSKMGMTILEVGGTFDPRGDGRGLSFLYGTRILSERAEIDATVESESVARTHDVSDTYVDALVGVRYEKAFTPRWSAMLRADVSKGGTELTWSAASELRYAFGKSNRYALTAGYRHMVVDFKSADAADLDMTLSGLHTGFRVSF